MASVAFSFQLSLHSFLKMLLTEQSDRLSLVIGPLNLSSQTTNPVHVHCVNILCIPSQEQQEIILKVRSDVVAN